MTVPIILIRVDCSTKIGYGHVMRCLTVARALSLNEEARVRFLMAEDSDASPVEALGFEVRRLSGNEAGISDLPAHAAPEDGLVLIDTYALTASDLDTLNAAGFCVAVFDDGCRLDDYPCGMVIDSAPGADTLAYRSTTDARFYLGPSYYPLRQEFLDCRKQEARDERIIVTFGGGDANDQTARVLKILETISLPWEITAILGPGYEGEAEAIFAASSKIRLQRNPLPLAPLMAAAGIAVSGAGGSALELAYLGTPSVLIPLSKDQEGIADALGEIKAAVSLNSWNTCSDQDIGDAVLALMNDTARQSALSSQARSVIDGQGAGRIAVAITETWLAHKAGANAPDLAGAERV